MQFRLFSLVSAATLAALPMTVIARDATGLALPPSAHVIQHNLRPVNPPRSLSAERKEKDKDEDDGDFLSDEDIADIIGNPTEPSVVDGKGMGMMPYYGGMGVTVDATVVQTVTPDFVVINAYCDSGPQESRDAVQKKLAAIHTAVKNAVGGNGSVRKSGGESIYPYYDPGTSQQSGKYSGSLSLFIRMTNLSANLSVSRAIENAGCTVNWDVRLTDQQAHEMRIIDQLLTKVSSRKALFERLLDRPLTEVIGASMSTYVDSYTTYDPEANTADATTTLTIIYDADGEDDEDED